MTDTAIKVENLSKRYRIGLEEEVPDTMAGALLNFLKQPGRNLRRLRRLTRFSDNGQGPTQDPDDVIWALKDVSFEVKRGEVVGIIGRNGAGKSTLLKILSRITHPTSGRIELKGRVSSLLEVGTGFHKELTGRENIYLNGTILGMSKAEVDRKFDEIVGFSGVEKFIDTPVKRYSSGMKVRLAFSVAAHLEPEILLVDEVLAVGDARFQKKCLGKMENVASEGRTVLFVSHDMRAIKRLCPRAIVLFDGELTMNGDADKCVDYYLKEKVVGSAEMGFPLDESKLAQFTKIAVRGYDCTRNRFRQDEPIMIHLDVLFKERLPPCLVAVAVYSAENYSVFTTTDWDTQPDLRYSKREPGHKRFTVSIPPRFLFPGRYFIRLGLGISGHYKYDQYPSTIEFEVTYEGSLMAKFGDKRRGIVTPELEWRTE